MKQSAYRVLNIVLLIDAILAIGFGLYSWFFPLNTFGTFILIPEQHTSLLLSLFSALSLFYILTGTSCVIGMRSSGMVKISITLLMIVRHLLEGFIKLGDVGEVWLIGNPYPDLIIHIVFIVAYSIGLFRLIKYVS